MPTWLETIMGAEYKETDYETGESIPTGLTLLEELKERAKYQAELNALGKKSDIEADKRGADKYKNNAKNMQILFACLAITSIIYIIYKRKK